jgi:HAMP domain-containing protein
VFVGYLRRAIVRPISRAASMAGRLAAGDLSVRLPENEIGEIGALERSFNAMGSSLERSRDELSTMADEQAALRRVATLVARGAPSEAVFAAVAEEAGRLLDADETALARYDPPGHVTVVAGWSRTGDPPGPAPRQFPLGGSNASTRVFQTGGPARADDDDAQSRSGVRIRSGVGAPINVEGRLWGVMVVNSTDEDPLPPGTEDRLAGFTDLVATAIANAQSQAELRASRVRIVATADETRRKIERDLHDGAQQHLVSLALQVRAAQAAVPPGLPTSWRPNLRVPPPACLPCRTNCASSRAASIPRSSPRAVSAQRCERWLGARSCPYMSTCARADGCPSHWRSARTTSPQRR